MDYDVPLARGAFRGSIEVPASKSVWQRVLVLNALADTPAAVRYGDAATCGDDVRDLGRALDMLGSWSGSALGSDRDSRHVDLGLGATGFRFMLPVAALRRGGARTLVGGRRRLLDRPHRPLLTALRGLGVRWKRRHSGAIRVHGGGYTAARVVLDGSLSSQFASALMLAAPRTGGIQLRFTGSCVSRPYLQVTQATLRTFGIPCELRGLDAVGGTIEVGAGIPAAAEVALPPDASAAAGLFAAAATSGASIRVPRLAAEGAQADLRLLGVLERMGASVEADAAGTRVTGPGERLRAAGTVDLADAPDLLPVVAALAAVAEGTTRILGVAHAKRKESDRIATSAAGIVALGGDVEPDGPGGLVIRGRELVGGTVAVSGDHRIAFAFGALGLCVPGVRLRGAEAVSKSHPRFLEDLARIASGT